MKDKPVAEKLYYTPDEIEELASLLSTVAHHLDKEGLVVDAGKLGKVTTSLLDLVDTVKEASFPRPPEPQPEPAPEEENEDEPPVGHFH